jgi:hypothetical protein
MNKANIFFTRTIRKIYRILFGIPEMDVNLYFDFEGQAASDKIKELLLSSEPAMISRLGFVELNCISRFYYKTQYKWKMFKFITREISEYWYDNETYKTISKNAGVFDPSDEVLDKYSEIYLNDMKEINILGSWLPKERVISDYLKKAKKVPLRDLEPYYHTSPWSSALTNKIVLVIHPFAKSIEKQYKNHYLLFENKLVLPDFELKTIQAVQSIAGNKPDGFDSWFEALDYMKNQISNTEFDIAIIGCGAYGLPLAAHVKRMGKKAIHLGGQTQVMFGIKGKRWEDRDFFLNMFNEHWIRPLPEETPQGYEEVENGCYW